MDTITDTVTLVVVTCYRCGTPFGIESTLNRRLINTGDAFYCPNGHSQGYIETTEDKLKKALRSLKYAESDKQWWENEAKRTKQQLSGTKGQLTKLKKRVANGVCPCCHRQFVNLHRHMSNKHPDYTQVEEENGPAS